MTGLYSRVRCWVCWSCSCVCVCARVPGPSLCLITVELYSTYGTVATVCRESY